MDDIEIVLRFWRALDGFLEHVRPTSWGAVVTDGRLPQIWDANYARVETRTRAPSREEIEAELLPALAEVGARHEHVVVFNPDDVPETLTAFSIAGARLSWDTVMLHRGPGSASPSASVEEVEPDAAFWERQRASLAAFDVTEASAVEQLTVLERDLIARAGKRWFVVREGRGIVSLGSLLVLEGIGYVDHVVTFPETRGRGYASAIVLRLVREARRVGVSDVFLLTEADGGPSALYERAGFVVSGRLGSTLQRLP